MSLGDGIMYRAGRAAAQLDDYFLIIKRCGRNHLRRARRSRWTWEIRRRSKPRSTKYSDDDFMTPQDAKLAGEMALREFLHRLRQR
jgi:hypothetical protein